MKYEWRKEEKGLYLPKAIPTEVRVPEMGFFCVEGAGNPNGEAFGEYIQALYSLAYGVRMSGKGGTAPEGFFEYTVYPLEGVWGLTEKGRAEYDGSLNKDELAFTLMIRQPDFVTADYAAELCERTKKKKPHPLLEKVRFERREEGRCVQMLHLGPYDEEPASFERMEEFCRAEGLVRQGKVHREIYLSDVRKTAPEKLKTVLRFSVEESA
ncbi:MAG: GyrI-like domain-containing protein [Spirochaetales bacterium]|nr:GyrI-like domain-containing protein [Spirochaetales bacterium]